MREFIYAFTGSNEYLVNHAVNELIKKTEVDPFNILTYDLNEPQLNEFLQEILTVSIFSDTKVVKVTNPWFFYEKRSEDLTNLMNYFKNPTPDIILIFVLLKDINKELEVSKEALKYIRFEDVGDPSGDALAEVIKQELKSAKYKINEDALHELISRISDDYSMVEMEIEKLKLYTYDSKTITFHDVELLVPRSLETDINELTNAVFGNDKSQAIKIYYDLLSKNMNVSNIISNLSNRMKLVITTKELMDEGYKQQGIALYTKKSSGYVYYLMIDARRYSKQTLKDRYESLAILDENLKSGGIKAEDGLLDWLIGG